ncbi:hypothetical protein N0V82_001194 [Gnomoniopsis sp. IMI 355080]|nr:hypothetical protein N0V82_001194 [Gnomoniopsis sp. IMI 355080]
MVMERIRKFAFRKRRPNTPSSQAPTSQSRHSLINESSEDKVVQDQPSSIQLSKQGSQDNIGATSQTSDMSLQTKDVPTKTEQAAPPQNDEISNNKIAPYKGKRAKRATKKAAATEDHLKLDSILATVDTVIDDLKTAFESGEVVKQRLNEIARGMIEAKMVLQEIGAQTTQLTSHVEMMQMRWNSAQVQFNKAGAIHDSVFDRRCVENHQEEVLADMLHQIQLIEQSIEKEGVEEWPTDKVNNTLSSLDQLHKKNKGLYSFDVVDECISTIMEKFFCAKIEIPFQYQHLWLVGVNALDFSEQIRKEDHDFTNTHKALVPKSEIAGILEEQRTAIRTRVLQMIEPQCTSLGTEGVVQSCSCLRCQSGEAYLELFCEYYYRQIGDELAKKFGGKPGHGKSTMHQGAMLARQALGTAYSATFSPREDISLLSQHLEELNMSKGERLTDLETIALSHVGTCVVCKQARVGFLAKLVRQGTSFVR